MTSEKEIPLKKLSEQVDDILEKYMTSLDAVAPGIHRCVISTNEGLIIGTYGIKNRPDESAALLSTTINAAKKLGVRMGDGKNVEMNYVAIEVDSGYIIGTEVTKSVYLGVYADTPQKGIVLDVTNKLSAELEKIL